MIAGVGATSPRLTVGIIVAALVVAVAFGAAEWLWERRR